VATGELLSRSGLSARLPVSEAMSSPLGGSAIDSGMGIGMGGGGGGGAGGGAMGATGIGPAMPSGVARFCC
jgi:hypothetical protein